MNVLGWIIFAVLLAFLIWQGVGLVKDVVKLIKKRRNKNEHKESIVEEETDVIGVYGERSDSDRGLEE